MFWENPVSIKIGQEDSESILSLSLVDLQLPRLKIKGPYVFQRLLKTILFSWEDILVGTVPRTPASCCYIVWWL